MSKTVLLWFHLTQANASQELNLFLNGEWLAHDPKPAYLGVTLACMLTHNTQTTKRAQKINSRNGLLKKFAGSSWGANVQALDSSAVTFCYSLGQHCAPVWLNSYHTMLVDVLLNQMMRITGTMRPTNSKCLWYLSNILLCNIQALYCSKELALQNLEEYHYCHF